ncbi:DUF2007 domain-containing protein [Candidatus Omnitrophota bacterium]
MMEKGEFKKVYSTFNPADIAFIKSILEENGIDYYVSGEQLSGIYPAANGMHVMVIATQAEQAKELIDDFKEKTSDSSK